MANIRSKIKEAIKKHVVKKTVFSAGTHKMLLSNKICPFFLLKFSSRAYMILYVDTGFIFNLPIMWRSTVPLGNTRKDTEPRGNACHLRSEETLKQGKFKYKKHLTYACHAYCGDYWRECAAVILSA